MNKAQGTVLGLLLVIAVLEITVSNTATQLALQGHPIKAIEAYNPRAATMFLVAAILLLFLADVSPTTALWITVLILVLVVLQRGNQLSFAFTNLVNIGKAVPENLGSGIKSGTFASANTSQGGQ